MDRKRYIVIFIVSIALVISAVVWYLYQLSETVSDNLLNAVDEISSHDVETIEGSLDEAYSRLYGISNRLDLFNVKDMQEAQEYTNREAASSQLFNAIYLLGADGVLYSSSYVRFNADDHAYDELFSDGRQHFVMAYDDANGKLETSKESLIYGVRLDDYQVGGETIVAIIGRSDLSIISDQLLIESFDGLGLSSVVNQQGYYIVSASPATDLSWRDNLYNTLEAGHIEDGVTIEEVRRNIAEGNRFVINVTKQNGERIVMSFAPVEGTEWSFIMSVPRSVFEQRFAPFLQLTASMLTAVIIVIIVSMLLIYRFMRDTLRANAESAARAEFLSNMSHEIRTPLNGIIGINHLMEQSLDDKQAMKDYVSKLGTAAKYLLSLVNDVLDMSKLQAGKVDLAYDPYNLYATIENVCEMQREPMELAGINFDVNVEQLQYPYLMGDEVRISQVVVNILSNAVKFTPRDGNITLKVKQSLTESRSNVVTSISIKDSGIGMTPEFREHIFDAFSQERHKTNQSQKGTGLGMAICNLIIKQMGGTIRVDSDYGIGSCFTVRFTSAMDPAKEDQMPVSAELLAERKHSSSAGDSEALEAAGAASSNSAKPTRADGTTIKLLVAEDNELNAEIIERILTKNGFEVVLAGDGQEAVDAFANSESGEFDAVLMDAQMPIMDGYEASREIRKMDREDAKNVRIFACTASTFAEDREKAIESGMDDFLPKPLDVKVMLKKLNDLER